MVDINPLIRIWKDFLWQTFILGFLALVSSHNVLPQFSRIIVCRRNPFIGILIRAVNGRVYVKNQSKKPVVCETKSLVKNDKSLALEFNQMYTKDHWLIFLTSDYFFSNQWLFSLTTGFNHCWLFWLVFSLGRAQ